MDYVDLRVVGTTIGSVNSVNFEPVNSIPAANGQTWTGSFYYKLVGGSQVGLVVNGFQILLHETDGTNVTATGGVPVPLTSAWQRAIYTYTLTQAASTNLRMQWSIVFNTSTAVDITVRIGWPQLEQASFAGPPIRTSNTIRNSAAAGAVVGTPGTPPTYWPLDSGSNGISRQIVGTGVDSGTDYIDLRFFGTATATTNLNLWFEGSNVIAASSGQTWSASVFIKLSAGSLAGIGTAPLFLMGINSVGAQTSDVYSVETLPSLTPSWKRVSLSHGLTDVATAFVDELLIVQINNAATVDFTLRIGWPQLEQSSSASPPQRTVAGTVGVNTPAEVVTLTNPPAFGSAYTSYVAGVPYAPNGSPNQFMFQTDTGDDTQHISIYRSSGQVMAMLLAGGTGGVIGSGSALINALAKVVAAAAPSDQAVTLNGAVPVVSALATLPNTPTAVRIGTQNAGTMAPWDGDITEFAIWPRTRLPNASLISGTT
jgi:hypothetical protein